MRNGATLEEDRYVVLLSCGHWTQTRRPTDTTWRCDEHGAVEPARALPGERAVLGAWEYHDPRDWGHPRVETQEAGT